MAGALVARVRARAAPDGEPHLVTTEDGWTLTVWRFRPFGEARPGPPVILGHGLMMNRWCWMLSEEGSMPLALAARGHDVWVPEYRGAASAKAPPGEPTRHDGPKGWRFEEHAALDLPAIIDAVCEATGSEQVHWCGHSMGGLVAYRYAVESGGERLASLVTLGSPVRFGHVRRLFGPLGEPSRRLLDVLPQVPVRLFMHAVLPATVLFPELSMRTSGTARYLTLDERLTLMIRAFEDGSPALSRWFLDRWLDELPILPESLGGQHFDRLTVPTLVLAGQSDALGPPQAVRPTFVETGRTRVAYRVFGDPSAPEDQRGPALGHADLISGAVAMTWVLPQLASWLESEDPLALPGLHRVERDPEELDAAV